MRRPNQENSVSINWEKIAEVKNNPRMRIPIYLNGDITSPEKVKFIRDNYDVDGVMIGREAYSNPYLLTEIEKRFFGNKHFKATSLTLCSDRIVRKFE